jgi:signal transduction histidine kinase
MSFINLPSGAYTLNIKAQDKRSAWAEQKAELKIKVEPPYWKSTTAYAIYLSVAGILLALLAKLVVLRAINKNLYTQVAARTEELKHANDQKSVFLANISHELRTPLNAVIAFSQRLISKYDDVLDEKGMRSLTVINRNGHHLNRLIDDLLDMSKIESGKMEIKIAHCNLEKLISDCTEDNIERAKESGLFIKQPEKFPISEIHADEQRLTQILHNLISNAIKYSNQGEIKIDVKLTEYESTDYCVISIADQGKGISDENQEKLFKRFEQVDADTKYIQGYGTGLGLAIVDEFTRLHGGFVRCESTLDVGSTFMVYIPIKPIA